MYKGAAEAFGTNVAFGGLALDAYLGLSCLHSEGPRLRWMPVCFKKQTKKETQWELFPGFIHGIM